MVYISRRETFSASHRLFDPKLTDEKNLEIFGKCSNPNGHGHNYELEVTVAGEVSKTTGYVLDLKLLKQIIRENVIKKVDHKNLNIDTDFLRGLNPTVENIAVGIWKELVDKVPNGKLFSVKLRETENNYVEYRGEES